MSSILDALNKLEQEKSQTLRESEHTDTDPISIANDLVGRSVLRDRVTLRVTPVALMISAGVLAVGLIVVTFAAAMLLTRSGRESESVAKTIAAEPSAALAVPVTVPDSTVPAASVASTPEASPTIEAVAPKVVDAPVSKESFLVQSADLPPVVPAAVAGTPKSSEAKPAVSAAAPKGAASSVPDESPERPAAAAAAAKEPAPASVPARTRVAARVDVEEDVPARDAAEVSARSRGAEVSLDRLPELTPQDQQRFGFSRIRLNMMKPSSETTPRGMALLSLSEESDNGEPVVNRLKIYEGERLRRSTLRLFKVEIDRIGIEDTRSGERYQLIR